MINPDIYKLIGEITALAAIITDNSEADIFITFAAHVKWLEIIIHKNGWFKNADYDIKNTIYLTEENASKQLKQAKQRLIKICLMRKVDLTALPFEIETREVKVYSLIK